MRPMIVANVFQKKKASMDANISVNNRNNNRPGALH